MKRIVVCTCVLALLATPVLAQESESTTVTTTTSGGADLMNELWFVNDATTMAPGKLDWRTTVGWNTGAEDGDSGDDFFYSGSLYWGMADNLEGFLSSNWEIGDGEVDHNGDLTLGLNWRFSDSVGNWGAMALQGSAVIPTGHQSSGVDAEARLIISNDYDSGIRSHVNLFIANDAGDENDGPELRDLNYGAIFGVDGPLCDDGSVRWVADYMWRAGREKGSSNYNAVELGWEWQMGDDQKFGVAAQFSVDHAANEADFGANFTYSRSLTF